jgi:hypothetical protein
VSHHTFAVLNAFNLVICTSMQSGGGVAVRRHCNTAMTAAIRQTIDI